MIRYDSEYNKNIARVVSNFNRKISRLQKLGNEVLPSKVYVSDIKSKFDNRRDLNQYLRDLQRFSKRGAENVVTIGSKQFTKYDIDLFRRRLRSERTRLRKDLADADNYKSKYPMQHDIYTANIRAKKQKLTAKWSDLIVSGIQEKLINEPYRRSVIYDNYLEILFQDAYQMGYPEDRIEYIKSKLLQLSPRKFIRALEGEPNIQYIFDYYHSLTRTSLADPNGLDAFDQLYQNIDSIVEHYK